MLLWLVFALMTAAALAALLHPLLATRAPAGADATASVAVYRDQLAEIDADRRRGLIADAEAEAASREVARRLLAVAAADPASSPTPAPAPRPSFASPRTLALVLGAAIPALALVIYVPSGAPNLPSQPIAARRAAPPISPEMAKLIGAVEERLQQNPNDGRGWDVIAPVYLRLDRFADAANAYRNAIRILGAEPRRLAGLAEALMLGSGGRVGDEARAALARLLEIEPGHVQARFWLAFAKEQDGKLAEALADYDKLLAETAADAPWRAVLEERRDAVRAAAPAASPSSPPPPAAASGPTDSDIAAASRLSDGERRAMIESMVSGLAARLEKNGRDVEGWHRLIRALAVLGRKDEAAAALGRARKSLADEPRALGQLAELARSLGIGT